MYCKAVFQSGYIICWSLDCSNSYAILLLIFTCPSPNHAEALWAKFPTLCSPIHIDYRYSWILTLHTSQRLNAFPSVMGEGFGMLCLIKEKSMTSLWIQSRDDKRLTQPSGTSVIQSEVGHSDQVTTFPSRHWSALKAQLCVCAWIAGFLMCTRLSIKLPEMWIDYKPSRTLFPNSCNCAGSFRDALSQPCPVTVHPKVEPISAEVSHLNP